MRMGIPRYAARRDLSEAEIVGTLGAYGAQCWPLSAKGYPDLLVAYRGHWYLIECKTKKEGLSKDQQDFHARAKGPIAILRGSAEAAEWIKGIRTKMHRHLRRSG